MSNADLIEVIKTLADSIAKEAADALAAADKRIAELEKYGRVQDPLADRIAELERKLAVAREALQNGRTYLVRMALINAGMLMQSGEFTTLVNDSLDEFINDHLHEVSDSESPIAEFDWARITIRKMGEALAQIGGEE